LIATGVAADQNLAIIAIANRQTRLAIVMGRAAGNPSKPAPPTSKRLGDGFGGHLRPLLCSEPFTWIAGNRSIHARKSPASTSVRRPRFTARSSPDLIA